MAEALWISEVTFYCQAGFRQLLMSGAFEKFPRLKYIITESGCAGGVVVWMLRVVPGVDPVAELPAHREDLAEEARTRLLDEYPDSEPAALLRSDDPGR